MKQYTINVISEKSFPSTYGIKCFEDKWLEFWLIEEKPKTSVFSVRSKCSNIELGIIKWHPQWRHYCFFPTIKEEIVYSDRCLLSISKFITKQNANRR